MLTDHSILCDKVVVLLGGYSVVFLAAAEAAFSTELEPLEAVSSMVSITLEVGFSTALETGL